MYNSCWDILESLESEGEDEGLVIGLPMLGERGLPLTFGEDGVLEADLFLGGGLLKTGDEEVTGDCGNVGNLLLGGLTSILFLFSFVCEVNDGAVLVVLIVLLLVVVAMVIFVPAEDGPVDS